jgi:hypothetical protein
MRDKVNLKALNTNVTPKDLPARSDQARCGNLFRNSTPTLLYRSHQLNSLCRITKSM